MDKITIKEQSQPEPMKRHLQVMPSTLASTQKQNENEKEKELEDKQKYIDNLVAEKVKRTRDEISSIPQPTPITSVTEDAATSTSTPNPSVGIKPTHNWVVIKPREKEEATTSGIQFPQTAARKSNEGVVVAVGPGRREFRPDVAERNNIAVAKYNDEYNAWESYCNKVSEGSQDHFQLLPLPTPLVPAPVELENVFEYVPIDLKVGDRVLYIRWAGYSVDVDGQKYYLVEEHNVVCVADDVPGEPERELAFWMEKP